MTVDMTPFNNRNQGVNQAFQNLIESQRQNEQSRVQQSQFNANKSQQDQQLLAQILAHYMPIQDPAVRDQMKPVLEQKFGITLPDAPPPPPPSPEELTKNAAQRQNLDIIQRGDPAGVPGQSMLSPPTSMMNAPPNRFSAAPPPDGPDAFGLNTGDTLPPREAPTAAEKLAAIMTARAMSGHAVSKEEFDSLRTSLTAGDQGLTGATAINDKRAPSWEESNLKLPESKSKIGLQDAQSFQARGAGTHSFAEAKRTGQLPIPPATAAPSSQPSYPHVLAKGGHSIGSYDGKKWYDVATGAPIN